MRGFYNMFAMAAPFVGFIMWLVSTPITAYQLVYTLLRDDKEFRTFWFHIIMLVLSVALWINVVYLVMFM